MKMAWCWTWESYAIWVRGRTSLWEKLPLSDPREVMKPFHGESMGKVLLPILPVNFQHSGFFSPSSYQLWIVSWLGVGPCTHFPFSVLGLLWDVGLFRWYACYDFLSVHLPYCLSSSCDWEIMFPWSCQPFALKIPLLWTNPWALRWVWQRYPS